MLKLEIPILAEPIFAVELEGEDYICYPFYFNVLALSRQHDLLTKNLIGKSAVITIGGHTPNPQYYNGLIYSITAKEINFDGLRAYQFIISPWLRFLDLTKDNRIYATHKPQTIPQIIEQVFKHYNCTDYDISNLKHEYKTLNYCVQYQESSFNFVSRLLEKAGVYYYFTHTQHKHTLVLADSGQFNSEAEEAHCIDEWKHIYQLQRNFIIVNSSSHQYHIGTVLKIHNNETYSEPGHYYIYGIKHKAKDYSNRIEPGNKNHAQEYRNIFYSYSNNQLFVPQARYKNQFMREIKKPIIKGIETATVVGPKGKEIYPDKYGRIKIQFHWDRYGAYDENSSCWIRLKQLWTGDKYGTSFIPRIGQEVLVSHEYGDPDLPLVIGIVPNSSNMMPFAPEQNPAQSGFRSVSGNEIRFADKQGQEEIFIKAQKDFNIKIGGNSSQTIGENSNLNILDGDYLNTVDCSLTIESAERIAIACGSSEIIVTDTDITIQADQIFMR
jgi:type VI secretion system secreted protein VgrG